jgi:hypothetical protein
MPDEIREWMQQRNWGVHHLEWHTSRQWDRLPLAARQWAAQQGWRRAALLEGEAGNGVEFLVMHRAMIELLREQFPQHAALFAGWATPPTDPHDRNDPLPDGATTPFDPDMARAVQRLQNNPRSFADDDDLGLYVETRFRPTPNNPFATSDDPSIGIHNYLHVRFQDPGSPVDMGKPEVNLGNQRFWRLHGWIDNTWSAFRRAAGFPDSDPALRASIDEEKHHLAGHMATGAVAALAAKPFSMIARVPETIRSPFRETLARRFQRLMTTVPEPADVEELKGYLQLAVQLEHFTIPIYLTAFWSLQGGPATVGQRQILQQVVLQEMLHMGLAANLLVAIGGRPAINTADAAPYYPDVVPGIDAPDPVGLEAFSRPQIERFLRIELPEKGPLVTALALPSVKFHTIGDFYDAIDRALVRLDLTFAAAGQRATQIGPNDLFIIRNLDDARKAVRLIKEQGEGTDTSQGAVDFGGELAHYYKFEQIVRQMKYVKQPDGKWKLDAAAPLPFPPATAIFPMAPVPPGGYPGVAAALAFDQLYTNLLNQLQEAWEHDSDAALDDAVTGMYALRGPAQQLMATPRDPIFGTGNYGPTFRLLAATPAGPPTAALGLHRPARALRAAAPVPGYARVRQILDDGVQGQNIGKHGPFWRTLTRDQFVAFSVFGRKVIANRPDGSFDPDESNLIKALEGRAPFGADRTPPPPGAIFNRMPDGFPPVPQDRIDEIRSWIAAGCPDVPARPTGWIDADAGGPADPALHVAFWRDLDNRSMFQATPQTQQDVNTFFGVADTWLAFARGAGTEAAWVQNLADPTVRDAVTRLEALQRGTVTTHYGRPVPLRTLLDAFEQFGADTLPDDPQRPQDVRHRMNGKIMWFFWCAFCDACLRLSGALAVIPAPFWQGIGRAILLGLLNDGLIRGRFPVRGFTADASGRQNMRDFVQQVPSDHLSDELASRLRDSGL